MNNNHRRVMITGAASGLGRSLANCHHLAGWDLTLVDKDPEVEEVARTLGATALVADLTVDNELLLVEAELELGFDRLFLNAGATFKAPFQEYSRAQLNQYLDLNIRSCVLLAHAYALSRTVENRELILVSSSVSRLPAPGLGVYGPSKAFQSLFGAALSLERIPGFKVMVIEPSGMQTHFQANAGVPTSELLQLLDPDTVALKVMKYLERDFFAPGIKGFGLSGKAIAVTSHILPRRIFYSLFGSLIRTHR